MLPFRCVDFKTCPLCSLRVLKTPHGWECEGGEVSIWKEVADRKLLDNDVKQLFMYRRTDILAGFVSKETGKRFNAKLTLSNTGSIEFEF